MWGKRNIFVEFDDYAESFRQTNVFTLGARTHGAAGGRTNAPDPSAQQ